MNTFNAVIGSPVAGILLKWTALLALGWLVHASLRHRHARWRLMLWRGLLVCSLALPLADVVTLPLPKVPILELVNITATETSEVSMPAENQSALQSSPSAKTSVEPAPVVLAELKKVSAQNPPRYFSWTQFFLSVWLAGGAVGAIRLAWWQIRLARLRRETDAPVAALAALAREMQVRLQVRGSFALRISKAIQSPFVCGLWRPTIMLPERLAHSLSAEEAAALLRHEVAHLRGHDLFWSVGWRWLQVIGWFHPLVWKIPAAHSLACEQEADRLASGEVEERASYAQLLAQLALRVLTLPAVETKMTLNGTAQIVRRLQHLKRKSADAWQMRHTLAGVVLAALLFVLAAGCEFTKSASKNFPSATEFKQVMVVVLDEDGKPLAGATVKPYAFRVQGVRRVDNFGWDTNRFGPANLVTTDSEGKEWLKYPVVAFPEEKLLTGELNFMVSHPDFCSQGVNYLLDGTAKPVQLKKGITLEVSGYYGAERQPVTELVPPIVQGGIKPGDWEKKENGVYAYRQLGAGGHLIQLMGRLASGELVFSDALAFTAESGKASRFEMEMKPGIRIEGRLDDRVPRPVKNGRVLISVRPPQIPAYLIPEDTDQLWKKFGRFSFWRTYRPIAEDGTFVFESVPPGEVDVIVHGDGFISKSVGKLQNRMPDGSLVADDVPAFATPQPFPLNAPVTKIEIVTEPTATLELTAKTKWGRPVEGATVYLNPNIYRMDGIFGSMKKSSEEALRKIQPLPELSYSGKTDANGKVVISNLPAVGHGLEVYHPSYVIPLQEPTGLPNRRVPMTLTPGQTTTVKVTMQPTGKDFIGAPK